MKVQTKAAIVALVVLLVGLWLNLAATRGVESGGTDPVESPAKVVMAQSPTTAQATPASMPTASPTSASVASTPTTRPTNTPQPASPTVEAIATPVPPTLTPWVITPQSVPEDVFAAATQAIAEATNAAIYGTPTPLPPNAVTATSTRRPVVVRNTPTPRNPATATSVALWETAVAVTTGTLTPLPENAVTVTPRPEPTSTPVLVFLADEGTLSLYVRSTRTPVPTPTAIPDVLVGKILCRSDYGGGKVLAVDPDGSNAAVLTGRWAYDEALRRESLTPDGRYVVYQSSKDSRGLDLWLRPVGEGSHTRLTFVGRGKAYDPAWSPDGTRIVFASNQQGPDQIFVVERVFGNPRTVQLTKNEWESDKHPSYSPDGQYVVFHSNRTGTNQLWVMNGDGTNQHLIWIPELAGHSCWDPAWIKR